MARDGIYESWIKFRSYPFLDPKIDYRRDALTASDIMTYSENIISIPRSGLTVEEFCNSIAIAVFRLSRAGPGRLSADTFFVGT